ncbi:hypothetical protein [Portibacter marinus]|uniref:hypothetical protein n=1 Tax=Portibacter marinus TaxID=2898660 RepID=UPI001F2BD9AD|nr:hypothetical protein [Portibacter marinus]
MIEITTLSWKTFLIISGCLLILYLLSNRTRIGRLLVERETPFTGSQWTRILLVVLTTCFILVNPLFHLLTFAIFAILYYILVAKNFLSRNIMDLGSSKDGLAFLSITKDTITISCTPTTEISEREQKNALDKCLFSFPVIVGDEPKVQYEDKTFIVELNLSSKKYTSSLMSYISRAGFEVQKITT